MEPLHVAVGVILDGNNRVLITLRAPKSHQGGLWEFPGGKVESGESVQEALARELNEELGIGTGPVQPFLQVHHDYADKAVLLDVWLVKDFTGIAEGREGQPLLWATPRELLANSFPAANVPIVDAVLKLLESR